MPTRNEIVAAARRYIGTPFKKGGRDEFGLDCVGLIYRVGIDLGLDLEDTDQRYNFGPNPATVDKYFYAQSVRVPDLHPRIGYLAVLRQSVTPLHFGIVAKDEFNRYSIINANMKPRRVIEESLDKWKPELIMFREYLGVTD